MDRNRIMGTIENFLTFMELAEIDKDRSFMRGVSKEHFFPLTVFKDAEPLSMAEELHEDTRMYDLLEQNPAKLVTQFDLAMIFPPTQGDEDEEREKGSFSMRRLRTMSMAETRGKLRPWTPHVVEEKAVCVRPDGTYVGAHTLWGWYGGIWRSVKAGAAMSERKPDEIDVNSGRAVGVFAQHAIFRDYLWHISVGYAGRTASLLLPCDAASALELFKFRDLPEGKKRRDALLHWVSEHWRRKPTDYTEAVKVHEHLRGQTEFKWANGLNVSIRPAVEDLKKIYAAQGLNPKAPHKKGKVL